MHVLIAGAGAAGLAAAAELTKAHIKVTLVDPRLRLGGRIHTRQSHSTGLAVDLGPEFIHGHPEEIPALLADPTSEIVTLEPAERLFWQNAFQEGNDVRAQAEAIVAGLKSRPVDVPVAQALHELGLDVKSLLGHQVVGFIEGFNAADINTFSLNALVQESAAAGEEIMDAARIRAGYQSMINALEARIAPVDLRLGTRLAELRWSVHDACATLVSGAGVSELEVDRVILTLPPSLLPALHITPEPTAHLKACKMLPMGHVQKVLFIFKEPLWPRPRENFEFLNSPGMNFHIRWLWNWAEPFVVSCWSGGGQAARRLRGLSEHELIEAALKDLATILKTDLGRVKSLVEEIHYHDWMTDPFSLGAYSFVSVGGETSRDQLAQPLEDTLFFAGEATMSDGSAGTVHGALRSGQRAAREILHPRG